MFTAAFFLALLPNLPAQSDRFGLPACSAPSLELAIRSNFIICYDSTHKVPAWTAYELKSGNWHGSTTRPHHFRRDPQLAGPSATDADYRNSGFNRGHMVPAADLAWSEPSLRDTFLLSNAVPQRAGANLGKWHQLENRVRTLALNATAVYVFSGPIFDPGNIETIGIGHVAVPNHTFKVVLVIQGGHKTMYAAIVPNQQVIVEPLDALVVTVNEVQRQTGLDFFSELDPAEQQQLESARNQFPERRF